MTRFGPPARDDPSAGQYKAWLHLKVLDHVSGIMGLVNLSLHGPPRDDRSLVVGTALFHHPVLGWVGNVDIEGYEGAVVGESSIATSQMALALDYEHGRAVASVRLERPALSLDVTADATAPSISYDQRHRLGDGWISWRVIPRMSAEGRLTLAGVTTSLDQAAVYHDSNWGRWHWGGDFGWEWGSFATRAGGPVVVFSQITDRAHRRLGEASIHFLGMGVTRRFRIVRIEHRGNLSTSLRRVPGAVAALHQDRRLPRLPQRILIRGQSGQDWVAVDFVAQHAAQVIATEPMRPGYTFIHESVGEGEITGLVGGNPVSGEVMGVVEHVD